MAFSNGVLEKHYSFVVSMAERLTRVPREQEVENSFLKGLPNLTQHCKRFTTASTSTQVAGMPWRYDAGMGTTNSLHAST